VEGESLFDPGAASTAGKIQNAFGPSGREVSLAQWLVSFGDGMMPNEAHLEPCHTEDRE
jgi:hypothetical protein